MLAERKESSAMVRKNSTMYVRQNDGSSTMYARQKSNAPLDTQNTYRKDS